MSENTILCKCLVCLKQNANGVPVNMKTYIRHHKNQQEFLDVEETNISHQEQNVKDFHQQEDLHQDLHQQEDLYQDLHQQEDTVYINRILMIPIILMVLIILRVLTLTKKMMNTILIIMKMMIKVKI